MSELCPTDELSRPPVDAPSELFAVLEFICPPLDTAPDESGELPLPSESLPQPAATAARSAMAAVRPDKLMVRLRETADRRQGAVGCRILYLQSSHA